MPSDKKIALARRAAGLLCAAFFSGKRRLVKRRYQSWVILGHFANRRTNAVPVEQTGWRGLKILFCHLAIIG